MSSVLAWFGGDPNTLTNYFLGLVIIVLYAKDKFNTPSYDKEAMGPFSQLPPQLLTIDARYRQGMRIYIFLLLALYTALCIIGPSTLNNQSLGLGFTAKTNQLWPVASATFLISTGAAKDSSVLGKIEHFIRQYAHRAAYIPSIVSKLAYAIRNVEITPWLKENKDKLKQDDFDKRKNALTELIGKEFVARINDNPKQQGHLAVWARANIVYYCMHQMFTGVLPSERLSQITGLPENIAILERLTKERVSLKEKFTKAEEQQAQKPELGSKDNLDRLLSEIQRFSKEVSLTIVIMLSQSVRTSSGLNERLEQLGFREIELHDDSGHLVYLVMVNVYMMMAGLVSLALLYLSLWLLSAVGSSDASTLSSSGASAFGVIVKEIAHTFSVPTREPPTEFTKVSYVNQFLIVGTGVLIYMIVFKVMDYLREGKLDIADWRENLEGYVVIVAMTSLSSAIIFILLVVLLLYPLGLISHLWMNPAGLAQQFLFQLVVAGLAAGFAVNYLHQAVKLKNWSARWPKIILAEFVSFRTLPDCIKLIHAVLAACLVYVLTVANISHTKNTIIDATRSSAEQVLESYYKNLGWLSNANETASSKESAASKEAMTSKGEKSKAGSRLPSEQGLWKIPCKLEEIHAVVKAFAVAERSFRVFGELADTVDPKPSDPGAGSAKSQLATYRCPNDELNPNKAISNQKKNLEKLCKQLNQVILSNALPVADRNSGSQNGTSQSQPPGQVMVVQTLFRAPGKCEPSLLFSLDANEENFINLGKVLRGLFDNLQSLDDLVVHADNRAVVVFPMVTAFLIAYAFGVGCRVWRAWWLNDEVGRQEIDKLKEQIKEYYGQPVRPGEFELWLTSPLSVLNNVAPIEAVRYEGPRMRLYAKIENKQIDFGNVLGPRSAAGCHCGLF